ncbi:unnamed protein product [Alopecurus aequalis]
MAAAPPLRLADSPPDELIEEILLRLPPDEPSCLLRASLVCKPWRRIISHRRFRRRLHELHGRPPVLGFLRNKREAVKDFIATTSSAFSLAVPGDWRALDCRHGRALLLHMVPGSGELVLWDPITGDQEFVAVPEEIWDRLQGHHPTAAIVCAAAGCDHCGCRVVLLLVGDWPVGLRDLDPRFGRGLHNAHQQPACRGLFALRPVRQSLSMTWPGRMLPPSHPPLEFDGKDSVALILTEDGGLGVAESFSDSHLNIWSRLVGDNDDATLWVKSRVIRLDNLLPAVALEEEFRPMSFAERANVLFIRTDARIFTIELPSERVRKVCEDDDSCSLVPIEGFYAPWASQGEEA